MDLKKLKHTEVSILPITKKDILVIKLKDDCPPYIQQIASQYRDELAQGLCPKYMSAVMVLPPGMEFQVLQVERDFIDTSKLNLQIGKKE